MRSSPPSRSLVLKIVKPPVPSARADKICWLVEDEAGNGGTMDRGWLYGELLKLLTPGLFPPPRVPPPVPPPPEPPFPPPPVPPEPPLPPPPVPPPPLLPPPPSPPPPRPPPPPPPVPPPPPPVPPPPPPPRPPPPPPRPPPPPPPPPGRPPPPPPPPPPRCGRSSASFTRSGRPSIIWPLTPSIARWACSSEPIVTKAKPRDCPVARSVTMWTSVTSPNCVNA